jgi:serine protease Do
MTRKSFSTCCRKFASGLFVLLLHVPFGSCHAEDDRLAPEELTLLRQVEKTRIDAINKVIGSVIAIYGEDRAGGGSGVIFDPSGLALTNHHVIAGAGVRGWGGLADGKLYRWRLVGTDPGGDVAIIKMEGRDSFPYSRIGNSERVKVGDWAFAMGNPFILAEDQTPTVTLGIVSGVERFQPGAGSNQLIYGNCIQVDSAINPGNSGGPLFDMNSEIIGINGRGSFMARGRVNVGLGYAISSGQIAHFVPDLMATKVVEHGTLDVQFGSRNGKIVCEARAADAEIAKQGLELGDELISFEGQSIETADEFTNLISTFPEDWPVKVVFRKADGTEKSVTVRLFGLPYNMQPEPEAPQPEGQPEKKPTPEQERAVENAKELQRVLTSEPGSITNQELNQANCDLLLAWNRQDLLQNSESAPNQITVRDRLERDGKIIGSFEWQLDQAGRFHIKETLDGKVTQFQYDGEKFLKITGEVKETLSLQAARITPQIVQILAYSQSMQPQPLSTLGKPRLDGCDKAAGQIAYRVKTLDAKEDWFFVWLNVFDSEYNLETRLLKASGDLDSDGDSGAVVYEDWRMVGAVRFPHTRRFVNGLEEKTRLVAITESVTLETPFDESRLLAASSKDSR